MKKIFILLFVLISFRGFSQVQATLKAGSVPNSVYVAIKSSTTLTAAKFSSFQFALGLPSAQATGLTATVTSLDAGLAYPPAPITSTENISGTNFAIYVFSGDGGSGTGTTYAAGTEYNYAEVFFAGATVSVSDLRIIQLPGGGAVNGQVNFYVAASGTDVTNQSAQFYAPLATNYSNDGNGYNGTSWARLSNSLVVLPVRFATFDVLKKADNALLTWSVENESSLTDRYEIERSLNSVDFKKFTTIPANLNGNSNNSYSLTDPKLSALNSRGSIYYRIKQVDKDAKSVYTQIRSVRLDGKTFDAGIYPNPVANNTTVSIDLANDSKVNIIVTDASGKQVQMKSMDAVKGLNTVPLSMSLLSKGTYMIKVMAGSESKTIPVVKDR